MRDTSCPKGKKVELRRIKTIGSYKGETLWDYLVKAKKSEKKST